MSVLRNLTMQRLMGAILFILLFVMAVRAPTDPDLWWHIRGGEYIVENLEVPKTDSFSYTLQGEDWIDGGWGTQIFIYGSYKLFGGDRVPGDSGNVGLALFTAITATVGLAIVYRMCEGTVYVRAFALVLGAATAAIFWSPRPHMATFILTALLLYLIHLYKREDVDRLWLIPPMFALWANLHAGFTIGWVLLLGVLAGEAFGNWFNPDDDRVIKWNRLKKIGLVTVLSVPMLVINPYGLRLYAFPYDTIKVGVLQDFIQEWASPDFHRSSDWPFAFLLLGVLALLGLSSRRIDWTDLVLVGGTAFMGLVSARNIATFAIVATPVFSRHLNAWLADRGWHIRPRRTVSGTMAIINWVLLIVILLGGLAKIAVDLDPDNVREVQAERYPVELAQYLAESPPEGNMFNSYNWGGYFLFAATNVPVYVDGRTDMYADAFLREFLEIYLIREGWEAKLDEKQIDFIAIEAESFLAVMLRDRPEKWREQQFDEGRSSLFVRTDSGE